MTVAHITGAAGFLHRFEGLRERLPGGRIDWLAAMRLDAAETFRGTGFPTRKVEAWHYTDLAPVAAVGFDEALSPVDATPELPPARAAARIVFVDGRYREDLSTLEDLPYRPLSTGRHLAELRGLLGGVADGADPLVALNTMLFEDGLFLTVPAGVAGGTLELLSVASRSDRPPAFHPRHVILLEDGASLTMIETTTGPEGALYLHNPVHEIAVASGAKLIHGRVQAESESAFQLSSVHARVTAGGVYDNFTINAGARLVRNEIHVALTGPKAEAHMNGAQLLAGQQHADTTTALDHAAPDCASRQTYKTVLMGRSRGVFQGRILVRQAAQKTDGYQMNQALLLSPEAEIDSKPQLEIYADDVKCSHGATVGELDADQLFYLRARGIPEGEAKAMLVEAFLHEATETVADETLRAALDEAVTAWWARQQAREAAA